MKMRGGGLGGTKMTISPRDARQRRVMMTDLVSNNLSLDEMLEAMSDKFGMDAEAVIELKQRVCTQLQKEYEDNKSTHKAMANRRISKTIVKAGVARQFGAVAQLEAQLSKIQGTEAPIEQHITLDATVQTATMTILGEMDPAQIQVLVAEELKRLPAASASPKIIESLPDAELAPLRTS